MSSLRSASFLALSFSVLAFSGCSCSTRPRVSGDGGGTIPRTDGGSVGNVDTGIPPVNSCANACGPMELCGSSTRGNGVDDDCNGRVDETCDCGEQNLVQTCFAGDPARRNIGACATGSQVCTELRTWSSCDSVAPTPEVCNGVDDDCNGSVDEGVVGCNTGITCPTTQRGRPLSEFNLNGTEISAGGSGWSWTIECPDGLSASQCPRPADPAAKNTTVYFPTSGQYRANVTFTGDGGEPFSCSYAINVGGDGLRVEVNWDTLSQGVDIDTHMIRWTEATAAGPTNPWFQETDCYYSTCTSQELTGGGMLWPEHANSADVNKCSQAPQGAGARWRSRGNCPNPRLDIDTNGTNGQCAAGQRNQDATDYCAPENINVDNPIPGVIYRIMVNYYGGNPPTVPTVSIFCGGEQRASLTPGGDIPTPLRSRSSGGLFPSSGASNDSWIAADVYFRSGTCGLECVVIPYPMEIVMGTGMLTQQVPFGPGWPCTPDLAAGTCE